MDDRDRPFVASRAHPRVVCLIALLLLPGCARTASDARTALLSPTSSPERRPDDAGAFRDVAIGLCEDYPREARTVEAARRDLEVCRRTGARVLRVALAWEAIEARDDQFDFAFWDAYVALAGEYGVELIPYVCYTPRWASSSDDGRVFWKHPPADNAEFAQFVAACAARYKGRVRSWELWNEPDNPAFWEGTAEQYAAMVKAGSAAVRAADPAARVVLGGIAGNLDVLAELFEEHEIAPAVDVVNLHDYRETWMREPVESLPAYLAAARAIVAEHGENEPLWLAEVGYSSYRRDGGYVSDDYTARYAYEHAPAYQAAALAKVLVLARASGELERVAWYRINDLVPETRVIGDVNNRHLGIRTPAGEDKPAAAAFAFVARLLGGRMTLIDERVMIVRTIGSDSVVHAFAREDGSVVVFGWLRTFRPRGNGERVGDAVDARVERIDLVVPVDVGGKSIAVRDHTGRPVGDLPATRGRRRGGTRVSGMELRADAVSVIELRPR